MLFRSNNGGVPVDYAYGSSLALSNGASDAVRIVSPLIASNPTLEVEIDRIDYATTAISAQNGISRELKNVALDNSNMDGSNWSDAPVTSVYGPGGRGTPKAQNATFTPFSAKGSKPAEATASPEAGETVSTALGTISPGGTATVVYRVTVADPIPMGVQQMSNQGSVSGTNFGDVQTDDPAAAGGVDPTVTLIGFGPTAADVSISGQVLDKAGNGIGYAGVTISDSSGNVRYVMTNPFGYYEFDDVTAGQNYIVNARHKRYTFAAQLISVDGDTFDVNMVAAE